MGRNYSAQGSDTNDTNTTILGLESATTVKPKIYDVMWGSAATPAEQACSYQLERFTASGTFTAVNERPLDPDDPAALAAAGEAHTVEPTYPGTAEILLRVPLHQRASWRWVANEGKELVLPATAGNGVGFVTMSPTSSYNVEVTFFWEE